jgi:hypothetical protein
MTFRFVHELHAPSSSLEMSCSGARSGCFLKFLRPDSRCGCIAACHRSGPSPGGLRHSACEVRRQANGRLSLLDYNGQAPALSFWLPVERYDVQLLKVGSAGTAASGSTVLVSFDVTNTGSMAGAEVAQLYVSDPSAKAQRPERELKASRKFGSPPEKPDMSRFSSIPGPSATGTKRGTSGPSIPATL